jgi:ATP-dependent DNA helicase DinG
LETAVELLEAVIAQKKNGETREQQKVAVAEIDAAIANSTNLLVEAGTGSGKTLSYLVPAIHQGARVVVATATKQLSEQIANIDIPFLQKTIAKVAPERKFKATLLKGRENYYCLAKAEESSRLSRQAETLFGSEDMGTIKSANDNAATAVQMAKEIKALTDWAETTKTGDRSDAPPVSDQIWRQYSSTTAECPGRNVCPLASMCYAERARDMAKEAQVVLTNHAVVGHDLVSEGESVYGDRDVFIFDEIHELDNYLTNAWGTQLSANSLKDALKLFRSFSDLKENDVEDFERTVKKFNPVAKNIPEGRIQGEHKLLGELLSRIYKAVTRVSTTASKFARDSEENERKRKLATQVTKRADEILQSCQLLMDTSVETVRWAKVTEESITLNAAPLRIGPKLQQSLASRDATMIGTSATITVGGDFQIPVHNLGLDLSSTPYKTMRLTSPFDYRKQAMIYIPPADTFPAPIGPERYEHTEAVKEGALKLVKASDGRALILCTTSYAVKDISDYLKKKLPKFHILAQGDAPNSQLIDEFTNNEESVLIATMGMWQGVNVEGASCSLVIMDKIPFKPMNDPLAEAQREWAEENGRNGFMDVYVASAATMLAQGAGRLVRTKSDRGVIAVFDTRLITKRYGKELIKSLPPAKIFQDEKIVVGALERLVAQLKK